MRTLVLGGTEFMGRYMVSELLNRGHEVTIVNRGNIYWEPLPYEDKIKRIKADRSKKEFSDALAQSGKWDLVVDFSAFDASDMRASVQPLTGKVGLYVYISTDSVCLTLEDMVSKQPNHEGPRRETDAVRPVDKHEQHKLKKKDSYGHGKLRCEEVLHEARQQNNFPFVSLRLPDVFGPYDSTSRHWRYQMWLRVSGEYPVHTGPGADKAKLSFVFRNDVVSAVFAALEAGPPIHGQAFNIGCSEHVTLQEYLELCGSILKVTPKFVSREDPEEFLPSVDFGPIDISKALSILKWKPTPLREALIPTCEFFEQAWRKYPQMRPHLEKYFPQDICNRISQIYS